jgi:hypothetical protein
MCLTIFGSFLSFIPQRTKETKSASIQTGMSSATGKTAGEASPYYAICQIFLIHAPFLINENIVCPSSKLFETSSEIKYCHSQQNY